jgi:predicted nucleotidyltransferase
MGSPGDEDFGRHVAGRLAELPGVRAVALGGSRASGTAGPDSDWDFAVYYRGSSGRARFDPASLRTLGWPGEISRIGGWGGGVFNGGAWLRAEGRPVDVHYRDLDDVERRMAEAGEGRFAVERLMFHLAGIPTYIVVAELAQNRVLYGDLPRPAFPARLRESAPPRWRDMAERTLDYAREAHARRGHATDTAGAIATAACQGAHAVLAARGEWVTNEKALIDRAGLRGVDDVVAGLAPDPGRLLAAVAAAGDLLRAPAAPPGTAGSPGPGSP